LPDLLGDGITLSDDPEEETGLDYEVEAQHWEPIDVPERPSHGDPAIEPVRFVDGKDVGRTVAWLQSREGYPVPVRLAEIGAVVMRNVGGQLRREYGTVERVVSLVVDFFPWDEVESFALALHEQGFRLLPCKLPDSDSDGQREWGLLFDFERMRKTTQNRSNDEMIRLERHALAMGSNEPTIVDGRLEPRAGAFNARTDPVVGIIKTHSRNYLHPQGWRVFYRLRPGQRTPAFRLEARNLDVISWYLRLDGAAGELPNWGVVRVELPQRYFEDTLLRDTRYLDGVSRLACRYRCFDSGYGRAAVSIAPIQRAEESLGAIFTNADTLISRFYHLTGL
jgi:hypothetical protein